MQLEHLLITKCGYGANAGKYEGKLKYSNQYGAVEIVLGPEVSQRILMIVAEEVVHESKRVAETLTANCLDATKQLTAIEAP